MKIKKYLKLIFIIILTLFIWNICKGVQANSINKISMDIYIDDNGNAQVTEVWDCYSNEGTEVYHPYYNLGNSEIKDLSVTDYSVNKGTATYTTQKYWKTSNSFSDKAYKCGLNYLSDGVEICWGISYYGSHKYTVKYTITNFVSQLTDSQMVYWTLIPHNFSNTIGSANIKIHSNFNYKDTLEVWGYGDYGAPTHVKHGCIEMISNGKLKSNEYMTILVKFPSGTFNATNKLNHNFKYYLDMAEDGATKYSRTNYNVIIMFFLTFFIIVIICVLIIKINIFFHKHYYKSMNKLPENIIPSRKSYSLVKKANYYRDFPCNNDFFRVFYIAYQYGIIKNYTDVFGAIILKLIRDSKITFEKKELSGISKKNEFVLLIHDVDDNQFQGAFEEKIFRMLKEASNDGILEKHEFKRWCKNNYTSIMLWFKSIFSSQLSELISEKYIEVKTYSYKSFNKNIVGTYHDETSLLVQEAEKISGFKKFLLDYTMICTREAIEVKLFQDYLIYAQMLGIADKVAKQFKNIYPEIIEQSNFISYDNIKFINYCSNIGIDAAYNSKATEDALEKLSDYSSGGGGYSSGGGGGGSFGGGSSGGGGFR